MGCLLYFSNIHKVKLLYSFDNLINSFSTLYQDEQVFKQSKIANVSRIEKPVDFCYNLNDLVLCKMKF